MESVDLSFSLGIVFNELSILDLAVVNSGLTMIIFGCESIPISRNVRKLVSLVRSFCKCKISLSKAK